jgi:hypothetical protein
MPAKQISCHPERRSPRRPQSKDLRLVFAFLTKLEKQGNGCKNHPPSPNRGPALPLHGLSLIGSHTAAPDGPAFHGFDPATGEVLQPDYFSASDADIDHATRLAAEAFPVYAHLSGKAKAEFLRTIAASLESLAEEIVPRACRETGLPEGRIRGELARTTGQLRLFASVVEEGSWLDARIDPAQPERKPLARADIRSLLRPIGPVSVFGASNFPLAFSAATQLLRLRPAIQSSSRPTQAIRAQANWLARPSAPPSRLAAYPKESSRFSSTAESKSARSW